MSFTKAFISVFFLLLSASLFAEKPDKILVCHVGSDKGSADQTYMENPNCDEPVDWDPEVEFRCPDAGKIDLILVSANSKHIDEDTEESFHSYGGFSDYLPLGEAGEDAGDFEDGTNVDGIDKGCELEEEANLLCPCWAGRTLSETVTQLDAWFAADAALVLSIQDCSFNDILWFTEPSVAVVRLLLGGNVEKGFSCTFQRAGMSAAPADEFFIQLADPLAVCASELLAIQGLAAVCQ